MRQFDESTSYVVTWYESQGGKWTQVTELVFYSEEETWGNIFVDKVLENIDFDKLFKKP
jgi:hypothetical protein